MTAPPLVSVVLACYNEEPHLAQSFAEIRDVLDGMKEPYEILFVDDVSRDRTRDVIARLVEAHPQVARALYHEANKGRGATVTDGFRAARGEIVGYLDVDLEVHARYIPSLVTAIRKGADIATVRRIYAFQIRSLDRYFMSRGYSWLVSRLLHTAVQDTESGYKFFRRATVLPLLDDIRDPRWFWDTEFMIRGERRGFALAEVPGAYIRRHDKKSTVSGLKDSIEYFGRLLAFRRKLQQEGPLPPRT